MRAGKTCAALHRTGPPHAAHWSDLSVQNRSVSGEPNRSAPWGHVVIRTAKRAPAQLWFGVFTCYILAAASSSSVSLGPYVATGQPDWRLVSDPEMRGN